MPTRFKTRRTSFSSTMAWRVPFCKQRKQEGRNTSRPALRTATTGFEVERQGETVILTSPGKLPRLEGRQGPLWAGKVAQRVLSDTKAKNLIVDLQWSEGFGGAALGLFLRLWKGVRDRDGQTVLCNVASDATGMMHATSLDSLWPILPTKEKALEAVASKAPIGGLPPR
jgi:anti-anti-sigma factor